MIGTCRNVAFCPDGFNTATWHARQTQSSNMATPPTKSEVAPGDPKPRPNDINGPKNVILDEAANWHADLIVVGSHGRRGLDRFLLGSVSETVAIYAHCSVEVLRSPRDQTCS